MNPAYNPTNITFLPDGGFNVGDGYGSNYLINYDKDGRIVKVFGGTGEKPASSHPARSVGGRPRSESPGARRLRPGQRPAAVV